MTASYELVPNHLDDTSEKDESDFNVAYLYQRLLFLTGSVLLLALGIYIRTFSASHSSSPTSSTAFETTMPGKYSVG